MANSSSATQVAVIGGGTGLTAAWALENQKQFNVTVFEESDQLGGHVNSFSVNGKILEAGAEFIGNESMYPNVHKLFDYLEIELQQFELNMDFNDLRTNKHIILPPLFHTSKNKSNSDEIDCFSGCGFFKNPEPQTKTNFSTDTILCNFGNLLNINEAIKAAKEKLAHPNEMITLKQFVNTFKNHHPEFISHKADFAKTLLYPVIAASWGVSIDTIKTFAAHYAMNYLASDRNWYDAPKGLSSYIQKMAKQCEQTQFQLKTSIKKIVPVEINDQKKYKLLLKDDSYFSDENGEPLLYDDVIITTPAYISEELIDEIENKDIQGLRKILSKVTYYETTVVFHQDINYLSPNNTIVHTRFDGKQSANTVCKNWKYSEEEIPVMKTWVFPGQDMPNKIIKVAKFKHPIMDKNYYEAQQAIHHMQGIEGLWHGGILAGFNDSHESGITAALQVATNLCLREGCIQENKRLALFPQVINEIQPHKKEEQQDLIKYIIN